MLSTAFSHEFVIACSFQRGIPFLKLSRNIIWTSADLVVRTEQSDICSLVFRHKCFDITKKADNPGMNPSVNNSDCDKMKGYN